MSIYIDKFNIIGDGRMKEISAGRKVMFYLSNMLPAFLGAIIIYSHYYSNNLCLIDTWLLIIVVVLTIISLIGLILWITYLNALNKEKVYNHKMKVKESNEISNSVSNNILVYIASILSIALVGGIKGFLLLIVLLVIFGLFSFGSNSMLFNPFLMLKGYRVYWMKLDDGSIGYLILRVTGGPNTELAGNCYKTIKIADYMYYLNNN